MGIAAGTPVVTRHGRRGVVVLCLEAGEFFRGTQDVPIENRREACWQLPAALRWWARSAVRVVEVLKGGQKRSVR